MLRLSINIDVDDLEKGVAFYTEAFGLTPLRRFGPAAVELGGAQAPVYILQKAPTEPPFPGAETRRDYARHWTPVHIDVVVEDLDAALKRAEAAGAVREGDVRKATWGRLALLADPFGHGFCLIEFSNRGYDEIATRG